MHSLSPALPPTPTPTFINGGDGIFKILKNGEGIEKLTILMGGRGILWGRSKNGESGGSPYQSNFGATKDA